MARWTGRYVCANYQSTLRANPFCPKAFDETRDNNNSEKKNDDERNFPETDRHTLILAVFCCSIWKICKLHFQLPQGREIYFVHGFHLWCFNDEWNFGEARIIEDIRECC